MTRLNRYPRALRLAAAGLLLAAGSAWSAEEPAPAPTRAENAASAAEARTREAPAVKAARESQPLDLRPDARPVPQVAIPLKRTLPAARVDAANAEAGNVNDDVARCLAQRSRAERRDCLVRRSG